MLMHYLLFSTKIYYYCVCICLEARNEKEKKEEEVKTTNAILLMTEVRLIEKRKRRGRVTEAQTN